MLQTFWHPSFPLIILFLHWSLFKITDDLATRIHAPTWSFLFTYCSRHLSQETSENGTQFENPPYLRVSNRLLSCLGNTFIFGLSCDQWLSASAKVSTVPVGTIMTASLILCISTSPMTSFCPSIDIHRLQPFHDHDECGLRQM